MMLLRRAFFVLALFLAVASAVAFWGFSPEPQLDQVLRDPGPGHWLGTDSLGRDLLVRVLQAQFYSWVVGLGAGLVSFLVGAILGFWAGWGGRRSDFWIMRVIEIFDAIPSVVLVTLFVVAFRSWADSFPLLTLALGIGLTHWSGFARLGRILTQQLSRAPFVEGARALGVGPARLLWVHLRPHLWPTLRQHLWASLPVFLIFESLVSFLGFGLQPPQVSLGILLSEGWKTFSVAPHLLLVPGALLFLTLLCFQIFFPKKRVTREEFL